MVKKTGFILLLLLSAQCAGRPQGAAPTGTAFADSYTQDGKPCPPECVSDTMEIVTWYPSPYNEYEELRLYPKHSAEESQCNSFEQLGLMYYNQDQEMLKVCRLDSSAGYRWEPVSYWKSSGDNIYNLNSGYVGIGKDNPSYSLDIQGKINAVDALCINNDCKTSWSSVSSGMSSSQISTTAVDTSVVKGYTKVTVGGNNYALPYYEYYELLVNGVHNPKDCTSAGGVVVSDGSSKFCQFSVSGSCSTCPSGWTQFLNWTETTSASECSSGYHSWSNIAPERCGYTTKPAVAWCGYLPYCQDCYLSGNQTKWINTLMCNCNAVAIVTKRGCF